jgi:polyisoprenoid-binding protein YceI
MALLDRFRKTTTDTATAPAAPVAPVAPQGLDELTGTYTLDPGHTRIGFSARHAMVTTVRGGFDEFEGTAQIDAANPGSSGAKVTIKAASINTGQADRDGHLRSADFLDVETFPELTYVATGVERKDATTWSVTGDLTIKGVTNPLTIDFEYAGTATDPFGNRRAGFEGTATINRKDWGLTWNAALETGGVLVSDKIKIELDVSAIATPTES